jgi:hypothetical protein
VDKKDEAEYVCIAENKAGEQDASIHLKVFGKDWRLVSLLCHSFSYLASSIHQKRCVHSTLEGIQGSAISCKL